jgi:hypothetical protein
MVSVPRFAISAFSLLSRLFDYFEIAIIDYAVPVQVMLRHGDALGRNDPERNGVSDEDALFRLDMHT